ncbi:MAG: hypothetical protein QOJ26_1734 [Thermoplasmata archaeon]|nr:hypothetical protein [Thermoplasmata archaeon]
MDPAAVAAYYRGKGYVVRDGVRLAGPSGQEHKVPLLAEGPLGSLAVFFGDFGGVDGPEMGGARKVAREVGATPVLAADEFSNQDRQVAARLGVVLLDSATLTGEGTPTPPGTGIGLGVDTGRAWPGLAPVPTRRSKEAEPEPHPWPASGRVGGRDGPPARAVDVDEILTQPAAAVPAQEPIPSVATAPETVDGETLWKRPRNAASSPPPRPRASASHRFGWLGVDVPPAPEGAGPMAVEYDDVVPAAPGRAAPAAPEERLGDAIELQPTMQELRHRQRRDRLLRRLFWLLFLLVVVSLVTYFGRP